MKTNIIGDDPLRWSKVFSILTGSTEETVLGAKAELSYLLGTRQNISNQNELNYVFESIAKAIPIFIESQTKKLGITREDVFSNFSSLEVWMMYFIYEYFIVEKNNKTFIQLFNRVLTHYYGYDGSERSMENAMPSFCKDLEYYIVR